MPEASQWFLARDAKEVQLPDPPLMALFRVPLSRACGPGQTELVRLQCAHEKEASTADWYCSTPVRTHTSEHIQGHDGWSSRGAPRGFFVPAFACLLIGWCIGRFATSHSIPFSLQVCPPYGDMTQSWIHDRWCGQASSPHEAPETEIEDFRATECSHEHHRTARW